MNDQLPISSPAHILERNQLARELYVRNFSLLMTDRQQAVLAARVFSAAIQFFEARDNISVEPDE